MRIWLATNIQTILSLTAERVTKGANPQEENHLKIKRHSHSLANINKLFSVNRQAVHDKTKSSHIQRRQ